MKLIFKASLDKTAQVLTIGIALLFLGIAIVPLLFSQGNYQESILTLAIFVLVYGISFLYSPMSYEISARDLIIKRPIGNVVIDRNQIQSARKLDKGQLSWSVRTFAVGGLFGYFGKFWNNELGHMTWYATRTDQAILILTNAGKKLIVTPNEWDAFLSEFNLQKQHQNG